MKKINRPTAPANTVENNTTVKALKKISECKWVGNVTHENIDKCLVCINLSAFNSGWYNPVGVRINGLHGIYMLNPDGSIYAEQRIIKDENNRYRIEFLTMEGWNEYERYYSEFINAN